jgi:hypothetical protein
MAMLKKTKGKVIAIFLGYPNNIYLFGIYRIGFTIGHTIETKKTMASKSHKIQWQFGSLAKEIKTFLAVFCCLN